MNRDENGKPVKQKPRQWQRKGAGKRIIDRAKERKAIAVTQRLNRDGVPV